VERYEDMISDVKLEVRVENFDSKFTKLKPFGAERLSARYEIRGTKYEARNTRMEDPSVGER
jgi:hypothetical protein